MAIRNKKDPRRIQVREFECTVCGAHRAATKWRGVSPPGHIKTMYCVSCKTVTDFIQKE